MNKTILGMMLGILIFSITAGVMAVNDSANQTQGCKNLFWFDNNNNNKDCGQKQFCGAYMYLGLQVFENKSACDVALNSSAVCTRDDDCAVDCLPNQDCLGVEEKCINGKCVLTPETNSSCKTFYWFDNENKSCWQKQFCGLYMYQGLQTFESKEQCLKSLNLECVVDSDCPQTLCSGKELCIREDNVCISGKCIKDLSNGRKAEIKIMPNTASQTAIAKLGDLVFTIELKEVGKGKNSKVVYELTGNKQGKFLGIFKIMASEKVQVDAETGEVKKVIKPWWSFLASGV